MSEELTCITCPMGCRLKIDRLPGGELSVSGNRCPRGAAYAREELLAPKRTITATAKVRAVGSGGSGVRRVPCRTSAPFPKDRAGELLASIYGIEVELPVRRGEVLIADALGLGIDVVSTRTLGSGE